MGCFVFGGFGTRRRFLNAQEPWYHLRMLEPNALVCILDSGHRRYVAHPREAGPRGSVVVLNARGVEPAADWAPYLEAVRVLRLVEPQADDDASLEAVLDAWGPYLGPLEALTLQRALVRRLPACWGPQLVRLRALEVCECFDLGGLPDEWGPYLGSLRELAVDSCEGVGLPGWGPHVRLEKFVYENNEQSSLRADWGPALADAKHVSVSFNPLGALPDAWGPYLGAVETLLIHNCGLRALPRWLAMTWLRVFVFMGNRLAELPDELAPVLANVEELECAENRLTALADSWGARLAKLRRFGCAGNRFQGEIFSDAWRAVARTLETLQIGMNHAPGASLTAGWLFDCARLTCVDVVAEDDPAAVDDEDDEPTHPIAMTAAVARWAEVRSPKARAAARGAALAESPRGRPRRGAR
jgi:hypothetical protein